MLGSADRMAIDPDAVRGVLDRAGVTEDLADTNDAPVRTVDEWAAIVGNLTWIEGRQVDGFAAGAPLILDDRPVTEYFLVRRLLERPSPAMNERNLRAATPTN
jgi:hypothetical protein